MRLTATRASVTSGGAGVTLAFLEYTTTASTSSFTLAAQGSLDYVVDWGDGTVQSYTTGSPTHTYSTAGQYVVKITPAVGSTYNPSFNGNDASKIVTVDGTGGSQLTSLANAFRGGNNITSFSSNIDTSNVTGFTSFLRNANSLVTMPSFDASSGINFNRAFMRTGSLTDFPANVFDTTGTLVSGAFLDAWLDSGLTAQSIENILVSLDTNGAQNITLGLSGGTSAGKSTWSTAANTAYNNLITKGWTITFNS